MNGPAFFQTQMGRKYYEVDVPTGVDQLRALNANLARIAAALEKLAAQQPEVPPASEVSPRSPS